MPLTVVRREALHLYTRDPRTPAARRAVDALLRLHHAEEHEVERARAESGLTKNEFQAVRYLLQAQRDDRAMGPKDVAVMLNVSNASVTKIVDALVDKGYLVRNPHPQDRRALVLAPTPRAAEQIDAAYERFHRIVVDVIDELPAEDHEILARDLERMSDALVAGQPQPA